MSNTSTILLDYIKEEFLKGRQNNLKADDDLLDSGILDSLSILRLVSFIEERFDTEMPLEDIVIENFQTVETLTNYLDKR